MSLVVVGSVSVLAPSPRAKDNRIILFTGVWLKVSLLAWAKSVQIGQYDCYGLIIFRPFVSFSQCFLAGVIQCEILESVLTNFMALLRVSKSFAFKGNLL